MQKYIAAILLLVLLIPAGIKIIIVADYAVRYDYYTDVLCENKDNKEMNCHGTCQLTKNLVKASDFSPEKPSLPIVATAEISAFILNHFSFTAEVPETNKTVLTSPCKQILYNGICIEIPTPPPSL